MASKISAISSSSGTPVRRERPWLLPENRRLRNLVSISLRNLALSPSSHSRSRGKTIDDDAVPNTRKSPAKLVALREQKVLGHSRSSTDLRSVTEGVVTEARDEAHPEMDAESIAATSLGGENKPFAGPRTPQRPAIARVRRRSTLEWANASPQRRQEKLETVSVERMADVFYSLHVEGVEEPVYISEIVERTMNPTFRHIDLAACGPGVTRLDRLTLRFWAKRVTSTSWKELLTSSVQLQRLQFLNRSLDQFDHPLEQNAIIFHLTDGVYTMFNSLTNYAPPTLAVPGGILSSRTLPTSSFDTLLRLSKLDDSIQDALATRHQLAANLENLLEVNKQAILQRDELAEVEDRIQTVVFARKTVEKQVEKARKQQEEKRVSLHKRRSYMAADSTAQETARNAVATSPKEMPLLRDEHEVKAKAIRNQRRRICEELQDCYPIEPLPKQSLAFSIRDLHLPNTESLDAEPPEIIAAALGHVAHIVQSLSFYLAQSLPYPVHPKSSTSTIFDPISLLKTTTSSTQSYKDETHLRTYPLFSKGVPRFRFEYAVFLLNKDIQILLESVYNIRVLDIRHTLPNLKYLLYVATAGEGELPARKAGGIRGLLRSRPGSGDESMLSRADSNDSRDSSNAAPSVHAGRQANGKPRGAVESLKHSMKAGRQK